MLLSPTHPDVAQSLSNLASVLRAQGKLDQAEPLLVEALEIWRKALPEGHPLIGAGLHNLAVLRTEQGRASEAEPLYRQALEIRRAKLGPRARPTTQTADALAGVLNSLHREAEADAIRAEYELRSGR